MYNIIDNRKADNSSYLKNVADGEFFEHEGELYLMVDREEHLTFNFSLKGHIYLYTEEPVTILNHVNITID